MIDKRLLKEMPETKPYIMKQVAMQWFSLLCNIVFVALLANVLSDRKSTRLNSSH